MKPIYLEINYFGPHEHSIIDFRKLQDGNIFLIGGDTGAGKSTIFDAMTYALFGKTTSDRDAAEMRSQFATEDQETKIVFYFEQSGKIYKVERTPTQTLARKRGTGTTERKTSANLSVVEDVGGVEIESIATRPVDVGNAIEEILNLNADQFKKIILLPQNDFSEFLKSKTDEKEKILKKIFGTQLFTDFTSKLKDRYAQANNKSQNFNNELKNQITASAWSTDEQAELAQTPNDQIATQLKVYLDGRQTNWETAQKTEQVATKNRTSAEKNYHDATEIQKEFDRLDQSKKDYQIKITNRADEITQSQKHVTELTWANPLRETVRDLDKTRIDQNDTLNEQRKITENLNNSQKQLDEAKAEIKTLTDQTADFEAKKNQAQKLSVEISKVQDIESIRQDLAKIQPQLADAKSVVTQQNEQLTEIKQALETKKQALSKYDDLSNQKDALIEERTTTIDTLTPLENKRNNVTAETTKLQTQLKKLHTDLDNKQAKLTTAEKDYQTKIQNRQSLMIAQLQQELEDNKPCPVCGALDHPYSHNDTQADEVQLRKSMDEVDDSQKTYAAAENSVKIVQKNIAEVSDEFEQKQQEMVASQMELSKQFNQLVTTATVELPQALDLQAIKDSYQSKLDEIDNQLKQVQKLNREIQKLEQQQSKTQTTVNEAKSTFDKLSSQLQTKKQDLDKKLQAVENADASSQELIQQKNDLNQAYDNFQSKLKQAQDTVHTNELTFSKNQTKLADNKERLAKQVAIIKELSDKLDQALAADNAQTSDIQTLEKWISELNQDRLSDLKDLIASYDKEKEILSETISKAEQQLNGVAKPELTKLKTVYDETQALEKSAISQTTATKKDYDSAQDSFKKVQTIMREQGDFAKELAAITSLYNVVNGKDGNDSKLKLETYVVQNYLLKSLYYANKTFMNHLSSNRYAFVISKEGSDKQRDHGLDINIYDRQTSHTRPSNTLSGGETFIAALSIALSLSEVVQSNSNGVKIDALFIDEGFGSLDDETLNDAMKALEDISKNRMVGVISHVDSMKQNVGQQLQVKKIGDGKSTIKLITK